MERHGRPVQLTPPVVGEHETVGSGVRDVDVVKTAQGPAQPVQNPRFVVYQESRHAVGGVPATNLGPYPQTLMADWMAARLAGTACPSERWYVDASGRVTKTPL